MARAPFQVLVIPYNFTSDGIKYCIFKREDVEVDMWQWVSGGGEDTESSLESAKREMNEETGVIVSELVPLNSMTYIPTYFFEEVTISYPDHIVIPEYSFGALIGQEIVLSDEHSEYRWVDYKTAMILLHWDSNKTALYELHKRLSKLELWDIYNKDRERTGKIVVRDQYEFSGDEYHLIVIIWIIDSNNKVLVQRRSYNKDLLPGLIATHGGSAIAGEGSLESAIREVEEEIGITLEENKLKLFSSKFERNRIYDSYVVSKDIHLEHLKIDPEEVDSCYYMTIEEIKESIKEGEFFDYLKRQGNDYFDKMFSSINK